MFWTESDSLDRRRFLAGWGAIAAGGVAASVGAATPSSSRSVEVDLEAREALIDVAGEPVRLLTYNGLCPGPLIRAREGQTLRVRLTNCLAESTNLHFHGLHVAPTDNHDNVFLEVQPGQALAYELTVPAGYGGTFW